MSEVGLRRCPASSYILGEPSLQSYQDMEERGGWEKMINRERYGR